MTIQEPTNPDLFASFFGSIIGLFYAALSKTQLPLKAIFIAVQTVDWANVTAFTLYSVLGGVISITIKQIMDAVTPSLKRKMINLFKHFSGRLK